MTSPDTRSLEHRMGDWARARLPFAVAELAMFVLKQGWACLFGGLLLAVIISTKLVWQPGRPLQRYDFMFLFAIATQAVFLMAKLETWEEARVIRTKLGSWYLLLYAAFVTVTLVTRKALPSQDFLPK